MMTAQYKHPVADKRRPASAAYPPFRPARSIASDAVVQRAASCACGGSCPRCQAKPAEPRAMEVSRPGDPFEREADAVAERVMRMPEPSPISSAPAAIQRKCAGCGGEATTSAQVAHASSALAETRLDTQAAARAAVRGGTTLPNEMRSYFEPRFGHGFSHVRVHADGEAATAAHAVQARAYTIGSDIVFGAGEYQPTTTEGRQLLAHELAHTVQQTGRQSRSIQRKLQVGAGLALDTLGFNTTKSGDVYTCPAITKTSVWNEIFTSLLFSPRIFKIAGATNAEVNANLKKHMTARLGIVDFASKKRYTFGAGSAFKMNPAFWIVDATGWRLKPGVDRDPAIQDLNVHPEEYAIACLAATMLTMEGGGKSPLKEDSGVADDDWIPGDWGYITNTNFPSSGGRVGEEGENIIYTGKDKLWGHFGPGIEYKTLREWFDQVKSWNGGANTEKTRTRPKIGLT